MRQKDDEVLGASWGVSSTKGCFGVNGVFGGRKGVFGGRKEVFGGEQVCFGVKQVCLGV